GARCASSRASPCTPTQRRGSEISSAASHGRGSSTWSGAVVRLDDLPVDPLAANRAFHAARLWVGHTIQQAADLLGVPYRTMQDWDRGVSRMPPYALRLYRHLAGLERIPFRRAHRPRQA